ncbi:RluA family pseudouridine synthase [Dethiothermospora halolimnae]|uniref:RluA family pseudouridine synthase n=1 Tax=Dethiothermospora halolimnae TaxID=3114390 RepID=UPI003CCB8106
MGKFFDNESTIVHKIDRSYSSIEEALKIDLDLSGRFFRKLIKSKSIIKNGKKASKKSLVKKGDTIVIFMKDEEDNNIPEDINLNIVYEDYDLIILNKEPGIVVHPTKGHNNGTVANGVAQYFKNHNINKKIRFVNRLDMDTSGIVVVAKNPFGHQQMSKQFENNQVKKSYLALVDGIVKGDGVIDEPIGKDPQDSIKNAVKADGKRAITKYEVIDRYNEASLVKLYIETGRTHQIRVHMDYIGHPIIGDTLYNKESNIIKRQALHSYSLEFKVPRNNEKVKVEANLPEDMVEAVEKLRL